MRLWHIDLIKNGVLPRTQLLAQWRELNSVYKKQDNHILINYIYDYDKKYLLEYSLAVLKEMRRRNFKIRKWDNFNLYFSEYSKIKDMENKYKHNSMAKCSNLIYNEHDFEYLHICFCNLQEKYLRGQSDFYKDIHERLIKFMQNETTKNKRLSF